MPRKAAAKLDPLDALAAGPRDDVLALVLWKLRHHDPSMTVVIKPEDMQGLADCCAYLKVKPEIVVLRPQGRAATPAVPPRKDHRGSPAMPAEPPRQHVVVALVNRGTMDAIRPLENNDDDAERLVRVNERKRWQSKAGMLSNQAAGMASGGDMSSSTLHEIAQCLQVFAQEG